MSQKLVEILLDTIPTSCFLINHEYKTIYCNQAAVDLFTQDQYDRQYLIDRSRYIYPDYESDKTYVDRVLMEACGKVSAEGRFKFEHPHTTLQGELMPCEVTIAPLQIQGNQHFLYYVRDLRENQLIYAEMKRREAAEEENRAKTRFLARMSHEIRTPMNVVLGITEVQLMREDLPPETKEALSRIYSSSDLLLTIINDILDLSKVEAGKMEIVPHVYETAGLIMDTVQLNLMNKGGKDIKFTLAVDENLPTQLMGDELRIKQILNNLLSNAFKYTEQGSIKFEVSISEDFTLLFYVKDTGQGMTAEQIKLLFESEFTRFNTQSNRAVQGSGLGMSIANQLITLMGGHIHVNSEADKGTIITVRIPQRAVVDTVLGPEGVKSLQNFHTIPRRQVRTLNSPPPPMPGGRVLVVDDIESNLYVARELLLTYKLNVDTAESGYEAVSRIKDGEVYDIIFMDHMMPGMDGIETTKQLRVLGYEHPIIALTANTMGDQGRLFLQNGFNGFVSKPIDIKQLNTYLFQFIYDKYSEQLVAVNEETLHHTGISQSLAEAFVRDAGQAKSVLDIDLQDLDENTLQSYITHIHVIKGALLNIGEASAAKVADALVQAARSGDMLTVQAISPGFLTRLQAVVNALSPPEEDNIENEDIAFLREQLAFIHLACKAYDITSARECLDTLGQKPWSKNTRELISEIATLLLRGYFEETAKLTRKALKNRGEAWS